MSWLGFTGVLRGCFYLCLPIGILLAWVAWGCLFWFLVSVFLSFLFYRFWFEFMICVVWGSLWLVLWVLCSVGGVVVVFGLVAKLW